jgi:hypothetical protein
MEYTVITNCKGILDLSRPLCVYSGTPENSGLCPDLSVFTPELWTLS